MPPRGFFAGFAAFALLSSLARAGSDSCSVFQIHTTIQGFDDVLSSDECADFMSNSSSLSVPCDAASCVTVVEDLVSKLPNCMLNTTVNKRTELQNALDECSADSSSSLTVETVAPATSSTPPSVSSAAGGECTSAEASTTTELYLETARSPACKPYATMDDSTMTIYIYAPCSATQCVAVMSTMVEQLPDCYTDGVNLKEVISQSLATCPSGDSSSVNASPSSSSSFTNECTYDEVSSLAYLTNSIVTSAECESYVIATATEWYIAVPCSATTCLSTLDAAVEQMPACEFEGTNYKQQLQQRSCGAIGSSEASGDGSANSLRTVAPASDGSVNPTDTSAAMHVTISFGVFVLLSVAIMLSE